MSSESLEKREQLLGEFAREVRQFNGLSASVYRAIAARIGMNVTDLQVIDTLDMNGPATAGQLAELMGLTTGAITGMIDRLEKSGMVRRERDPEDRRRVIVRLTSSEEALRSIGPTFDSLGQTWDQIAAGYDDEQLALVVDFLKWGNMASREEIGRLREAPGAEGGDSAAPLGDIRSGRLVVLAGQIQLAVRADTDMAGLYRGSFTGSAPNVTVEEGLVTIRYPQRLWFAGLRQRTAEVVLNAAVPWEITVRAGTSEVTATLGGLNLLALEANGAGSTFRLGLPEPSGAVPVRIGGSGSEFDIRRPAQVAARVRLKGWASQLTFDDRTATGAGSDMRMQSPDYEDAARRYDIEVSGSASRVTISSG